MRFVAKRRDFYLHMSKKSSNFAAQNCFETKSGIMKKYLFISLMALVTMVFTGCEKSEQCRYQKMTVDIPVASADWAYDDQTRQLFVTVPVKSLTEEAYRYGNISMYHVYHKGKSTEFMTALPETVYKETTVEGSPYLYQEHFEWTFAPGFVEIVLTISDFYYDDYHPEDTDFKLQIIY